MMPSQATVLLLLRSAGRTYDTKVREGYDFALLNMR